MDEHWAPTVGPSVALNSAEQYSAVILRHQGNIAVTEFAFRHPGGRLGHGGNPKRHDLGLFRRFLQRDLGRPVEPGQAARTREVLDGQRRVDLCPNRDLANEHLDLPGPPGEGDGRVYGGRVGRIAAVGRALAHEQDVGVGGDQLHLVHRLLDVEHRGWFLGDIPLTRAAVVAVQIENRLVGVGARTRHDERVGAEVRAQHERFGRAHDDAGLGRGRSGFGIGHTRARGRAGLGGARAAPEGLAIDLDQTARGGRDKAGHARGSQECGAHYLTPGLIAGTSALYQ